MDTPSRTVALYDMAADETQNKERGHMRWSSAVVRTMLVLPVVVFTVGCAGSVTVTTALICENTGGKYVNRTWRAGSTRRAEAICSGFGGSYSAKNDECTFKTP